MKTKTILLFFLQLAIFSCTSQHKKINGLSFVAARDTINNKHIAPVLNVQSNFVALMPFGFIRTLSSPEISHNTDKQWFGETEKGVLQYAKMLQKEHISIMVKPQIWVWQGAFTGNIAMKTEENWKVLENSYTEFIMTYAIAAEKLKATIFCIGTELEQFVQQRPQYWQQLIKKIKTVYKGKLTYAANWDEYKRVPFWDALDYIGVDAYFPLSNQKTPSLQDLEIGWKPHKTEMMKLQKQIQKQVLFTEYGYRSVDFSGKQPWDASGVEGAVNLEAQINGLRAIHNQFWKEEWFAGGFIWKWFHAHEKVGGTNNNRFTPQNKPAEKVLKELYSQ